MRGQTAHRFRVLPRASRGRRRRCRPRARPPGRWRATGACRHAAPRSRDPARASTPTATGSAPRGIRAHRSSPSQGETRWPAPTRGRSGASGCRSQRSARTHGTAATCHRRRLLKAVPLATPDVSTSSTARVPSSEPSSPATSTTRRWLATGGSAGSRASIRRPAASQANGLDPYRSRPAANGRSAAAIRSSVCAHDVAGRCPDQRRTRSARSRDRSRIGYGVTRASAHTFICR